MCEPPSNRLAWSTLLPRLTPYLPAELFNRLRELPPDLAQDNPASQADISRQLRVAVETLEPLHRTFINYTPRYLLALEPTPGQPHGELIEGSFLFADVTGFTALTELLSRQDPARGRENMARLMNRLFAAILDPLIASGGDLLIFAGDAALAYFPKQDHDQELRQAIRTGLRMQRAIRPFARLETEYGPCTLTMSIGLERGTAYAGVVGTGQRMELLVSGPAIGAASRAEANAAAGELCLGPQAQASAAAHFRLAGARVVDDLGTELDDYEISRPTRKAGRSIMLGLDIPDLLQTLDNSLRRIEWLAPFLPKDFLALLVNTDRQRQLQPEFRPVASQFVNIAGLEEIAINQDVELATTILQRLFVRTQDIVTQHQGLISQVDAYGDNFILLNTFGVPIAHEGTRRLAVAAALQLAQAVEQVNREFNPQPPLRQRSGMTFGLTFNGEIGTRYRREAVIAGPAVNRAARLMSQAEYGQVMLDADIWSRVQSVFVGEPLEAVKLKGIETPVVIVNVRQVRLGARLPSPNRPPLERELVRKQLARALANLLDQQQRSSWLIRGETGSGKSTLVAELAHLARQQAATVLVGRGLPYGQHFPLLLWRDLLTGWLDADENNDPSENRQQLQAALAGLDMTEAESALADLMDLPGADLLKVAARAEKPGEQHSLLKLLNDRMQQSKESIQPDSSGWSTLLANRLSKTTSASLAELPETKSVWQQLVERASGPAIIGQLLARLAKRQPLLVILEDINWADDDSLALLTKLTDLPLLLVATTNQADIIDQNRLTELSLGPLSNKAIVEVAQRALGARSLDEALAGWICQQAAGNPLFAEELCYELQQSGGVYVDRNCGQVYWTRLTPTLPLSLHQLLLARIDDLPLLQQELLKRAAVIGMEFSYNSLAPLCQDRLSSTDMQVALEGLGQAGLLAHLPASQYRFSHPLLQETIYTTLSYKQRQLWHTQIGDWLLEQIEQEPAGGAAELLAYHYLRGADGSKAAEFGRQAGDNARAQGMYSGALEYYQQVLALTGVSQMDRLQAAEGLADVLACQGDYTAAAGAYDLALRLGSADAAGKQAILSGDLNWLAETKFSPSLQPWSVGARAWLLALAGQYQSALELVRQILAAGEGQAAEALIILESLLEQKKPPGQYQEWVCCFINETMRGDSRSVI